MLDAKSRRSRRDEQQQQLKKLPIGSGDFKAVAAQAALALLLLAASCAALAWAARSADDNDAGRLRRAIFWLEPRASEHLVALWACLGVIFILYKARRLIPLPANPTTAVLPSSQLIRRKKGARNPPGDQLVSWTDAAAGEQRAPIVGGGCGCASTVPGRRVLAFPSQNAKKLTVVLDLDYTLLVCYAAESTPLDVSSALDAGRLSGVSKHCTYGGKRVPVRVVHRPWVREFLEKLSSFAELVMFTAGAESYAGPLIKSLDPCGELFSAVLYRDSTVNTRYQENVKDLSLLGRDLGRTVLVDDRPFSGLLQPFNLLPCPPFLGDPNDCRLQSEVLPRLQHLAGLRDVRPVLKEGFRVDEYFVGYGIPRHFVDACVGNRGCTCSLQLKKRKASCAA